MINRSIEIILSYFLLFSCLSSYSFAQKSQTTLKSNSKIHWMQIAPDIEYTSVQAKSGLVFGVNVKFIRTSLKHYTLDVITTVNKKGLEAKSACKNSGYVFCINANFFDKNSKPLGLIIKNGTIISKNISGTRLLSGFLFYSHESFGISNAKSKIPLNTLTAIQAGPLLLFNKQKQAISRLKQESSNRSGVCIDKNNRLLLFATDTSLGGLNLLELQDFLLQENINCVNALNLDGGGSTQMFLNIDALKSNININSHRIPRQQGDKPSPVRVDRKLSFAPPFVDPATAAQHIDINGRDSVPVILVLNKKSSIS